MRTKCWLRSRGEPAVGSVYAEWARTQNEAYLQDALKKLLAVFFEGDHVTEPPISKSFLDATWRIAIDVRLRTNELESACTQLKGSPPKAGAAPPSLSPIVLKSPTGRCRARWGYCRGRAWERALRPGPGLPLGQRRQPPCLWLVASATTPRSRPAAILRLQRSTLP